MAAQTATDAIYRALRTPEPDPDLAHAAVEEIRELSGQNVIAVVGSQIAELKAQIADFRAETKAEIAELRAGMKAGFAEVNACINAQAARIDAQAAHIDAQTSRVDNLQRVIWRVIWPLIALLAAPVFALLYKVLTT